MEWFHAQVRMQGGLAMRWMVVAMCLATLPAQAAEVDVQACKKALEDLKAATESGYKLSLLNLELLVRIEAHKINSDEMKQNSEDIGNYAKATSKHIGSAMSTIFPMCLQAAKEAGAKRN
ncbi:hypothetical protein ACM64Y_00655 [Novispirillum sp. DQ9]|uniref:hypothetical protein n=1 Tax=Novispirillum sp. DQ9 TaxID=3398612 RepID=UPI003C7B2064